MQDVRPPGRISVPVPLPLNCPSDLASSRKRVWKTFCPLRKCLGESTHGGTRKSGRCKVTGPPVRRDGERSGDELPPPCQPPAGGLGQPREAQRRRGGRGVVDDVRPRALRK